MTEDDAARYVYRLVMEGTGVGEEGWPRTSEETREEMRAHVEEIVRRLGVEA